GRGPRGGEVGPDGVVTAAEEAGVGPAEQPEVGPRIETERQGDVARNYRCFSTHSPLVEVIHDRPEKGPECAVVGVGLDGRAAGEPGPPGQGRRAPGRRRGAGRGESARRRGSCSSPETAA